MFRTELSERFDMRIPVWGFSYEPDVVAAISREGGFGVLGCLRYGGDADEMHAAIEHVEKESGGRPFGVNVVMPVSSQVVDGDLGDLEDRLKAMIPEQHREFIERFLAGEQVPEDHDEDVRGVLGWTPQTGDVQLEVAFEHDIALLASALGPPPVEAVEEAHRRDIPVSALVGRVDQARTQRDRGVDIIIAQGTEAGGHTGEIATLVLVPEVVEAVAPAPVLAAGGIGRGSQLAAAIALGAEGAWTGSVWLATVEMALPEALRDMIVEAAAADTIRSRSLTGKPARQLRTRWIDAWEDPDTPDPLEMPLQYLLTSDALARMRAAGRHDLVGTPAGQIIGSLDGIRPVAEVLAAFAAGAGDAADRLDRSRS